MREPDDYELLSLLKNDSLIAYETLFRKYYKLLCLHATFFLKDEVEAEDLVVELFVEIWDKKIYRKIENSFKAYLFRAVRNKCINAARKNKISKQKQENYCELRQYEREPIRIEQRELAANIDNVLQEFPTQRLRAFTLVYVEKKRYKEAADEMELSINSVKTHLKLALKVLRIKLQEFR